MAKLQNMFKKQLELQERLFKDKLGKDFIPEISTNKFFHFMDNIYMAVEELHEMGRELPYMKYWKTYESDTETVEWCFRKAKKEYVDVIHFMINIGLIHHLKPRSFNFPDKLDFIEATYKERSQIIKEASFECEKTLYAMYSLYENAYKELTFQPRPLYDLYFKLINNMLTIASALHMSLDEIYDTYMDKNKENHTRQDNNY